MKSAQDSIFALVEHKRAKNMAASAMAETQSASLITFHT